MHRMREALVFISDDLKHDADAVDHFRHITYTHMSSVYGITQVEEFSDCCAQQYRCGKSFVDISMAPLAVRHHYFEASHGKSSADELGATTKYSAMMAVLRREYTTGNAREFYEFCEAKLTSVGDSVLKSQSEKYKSSSRKFFYVAKEEVQRNRLEREVLTVKGTMKVHCVTGTGRPYEVKLRDLTCTCKNCRNHAKSCLNEEYVGNWKSVRLREKKHIDSADESSCPSDVECQSSHDNSDVQLQNPRCDDIDLTGIISTCLRNTTFGT